MRLGFLVFLVALFSMKVNAQIEFKKGYILTASGQLIDCYILNQDWKDNPVQIKYKIGPDSDVNFASLEEIQEFGISGITKYQKHILQVDKSGNLVSELTTNRNPEFVSDTVLLKFLIEGKASLFQYEKGQVNRFFYTINESKPEQLVYKRYRREDDTIAENQQYKSQLFGDLTCEGIERKEIEQLKYFKKNLTEFFELYNSCAQAPFTVFKNPQQKSFFSMSMRPGLNFSTLWVNNGFFGGKVDFDDRSTQFRLGVEAEFFLPFNNRTWSVFLEPTFRSYSAQKEWRGEEANISYQSLELPIGVRYNKYFNKDYKLFVNGFFVADKPFNSSLELPPHYSLEIAAFYNYGVGLGFETKNKVAIEMRYFSRRHLFTNTIYWESNYSNYSLILGYRLF